MATKVKATICFEIEVPHNDLEDAYDHAERSIVEQAKALGWNNLEIDSMEYVSSDAADECDDYSDRAYEELRDKYA